MLGQVVTYKGMHISGKLVICMILPVVRKACRCLGNLEWYDSAPYLKEPCSWLVWCVCRPYDVYVDHMTVCTHSVGQISQKSWNLCKTSRELEVFYILKSESENSNSAISMNCTHSTNLQESIYHFQNVGLDANWAVWQRKHQASVIMGWELGVWLFCKVDLSLPSVAISIYVVHSTMYTKIKFHSLFSLKKSIYQHHNTLQRKKNACKHCPTWHESSILTKLWYIVLTLNWYGCFLSSISYTLVASEKKLYSVLI